MKVLKRVKLIPHEWTLGLAVGVVYEVIAEDELYYTFRGADKGICWHKSRFEIIEESVSTDIPKPCLGVLPRDLWLENLNEQRAKAYKERQSELIRALYEYDTQGLELNTDWIDELHDITCPSF